MSGTTRKILLDTDPGVGIPGTDADDPIALLLALADPRLELLAVTTTFGNCPPDLTARGAAAVLAVAGRTDIPVSMGRATPLRGELAPELREAYAGARGREGRIQLPGPKAISPMSAPKLIAETVKTHPGEVTVVTIGPQTNLAEALLEEPTLADLIHSVVFMGGGLGIEPTYGHGNITPYAECNIYFDAAAADVVLRSGADVNMVGLDVTNPATGLVLEEDTVRSIEPTTPARKFFADVCSTYLDAPMFNWGHGCVLYDPLAVLAAAEPVGEWQDLHLRVETGPGETHGATVRGVAADPFVHVMVDVDGRSAVDRIVRTILTL
jgi:inosine-uridine nucleoside N-ribohydrolase